MEPKITVYFTQNAIQPERPILGKTCSTKINQKSVLNIDKPTNDCYNHIPTSSCESRLTEQTSLSIFGVYCQLPFWANLGLPKDSKIVY